LLYVPGALLLLSCALLAAAGAGAAPRQGARPNVLVILIDDLGWKDTAVYGSTFYETPRIDRLAAGGARFPQFYTAGAICSPTRASLMTGKSPARVHITDWIGGNETGALLPAPYAQQLPLAEVTLGEAFQAAGYETGYIGKWHLGTGPFMPSAQGFAYTRAVNGAGQPGSYFPPYRSRARSDTDVPDLEGPAGDEYLTDRLTTEAVQFLRTPRTRPFLLVLSHYAVHTPIEARKDLTGKYAAKRTGQPAPATPAAQAEGPAAITKLHQDHPAYAAMIESVDASVGRLLDTLDAMEIANDTIVVFVSDNGGLSTLRGTGARMPTSNAPLRAGKGWLYEGGIRAPLIVRWPGQIGAGAAVDTPSISNDVYPTLLELAGLPARPSQHADGVSLAPLLRGGGTLARTALHWHAPHYHGSGSTPAGAIRKGSMKLIEWFEDGSLELYDLAADPGERHNLAADRAKEAAGLRAELARWRERVGARMPGPRPAAAPAPGATAAASARTSPPLPPARRR
jgi:arylsulfatase A-like enzyme